MKYLYLILFLFLCSCHKKIIKAENNYEGEWGAYCDCLCLFDIDSNSHLIYRKNCSVERDDKIEGTARLDKDEIHVGLHSFKIINPPSKIDYSLGQDTIYFYSFSTSNPKMANWQMTLKLPKSRGSHEIKFYKE